MSVDVFISYDPRDASHAATLKKSLQAKGLTSFSEKHDLFPGDLWDEEIPRALRDARLVVILISPHWPKQGDRSQDWYGSERLTIAVHRAESSRRLILVPVVLPEVAPEQVPYGLVRIKGLELATLDFDPVAAQVRGALDRRHAQQAAEREGELLLGEIAEAHDTAGGSGNAQ